jgi:hypothetical protein
MREGEHRVHRLRGRLPRPGEDHHAR